MGKSDHLAVSLERRSPGIARLRRRYSSLLFESLEGRRLLTAVVVNTTTDSAHAASLISLRDAVAKANASTTPTTITFASSVFGSAKTLTLTSPLELSNRSEATTVIGPSGLLIITGPYNNLANAFVIDSGVTAQVSHLTMFKEGMLNHGSLSVQDISILGVNDPGNVFGGAIANEGTLTATGCTFADNTIGSSGGGIYNTGTMTITNATISGNNASNDNGGGIYNEGSATLVNVTIANNIGGGIDCHAGSVSLINVTVSGNSARFNGGGIAVIGGTVSIANCLVSGNTLSGSGSGPDVYGRMQSRGHNLIGKIDAGNGFVSSDLTGTAAKPLDAKLSPLGYNGGSMQTMVPGVGSPAIDHGSNALIPQGTTSDQRGGARIVNSTVDIGAVEVGALAWGKKVSATFRSKTNTIASSLKIDPNWLMAAMAFETGQSFSASVANAVSGAVGLVQFTSATAIGLGTTTALLKQMTPEKQLDYVAAYFKGYAGKLKNLGDVYMKILYPPAIGKPDTFVLFDKNSTSAQNRLAYQQNIGLDKDKNGKVTRTEAIAPVMADLTLGLTSTYFG